MTRVISIEDLKGLFTKPYGEDAPTKQKWAEFYNQNVIFVDPTQKTEGLDSYIKAQERAGIKNNLGWNYALQAIEMGSLIKNLN